MLHKLTLIIFVNIITTAVRNRGAAPLVLSAAMEQSDA